MHKVSRLKLEFHDGSIKMLHPDLIDFRKEYLKPNVAQISPGKLAPRHTYIEAIERFNQSQLMTNEGPYNEKMPSLTGAARDRSQDQEINPPMVLKNKKRRDSAIEGAIRNKVFALEPQSEKPVRFRSQQKDNWIAKNTMNFN